MCSFLHTMLTGLTEVAGVGSRGDEFWCWLPPPDVFRPPTLDELGPMLLPLMWCKCVAAEELVGVTAEVEADELRKELWCDFMDCATAAAAAAAAEEPLEEEFCCDELLDLLALWLLLLLADEEWWLFDLEEEFVVLELLLPLFDALRDEDDEHEAEPELTDFELLRLLDCCCCCNCWRHLALRFLNHTWK